MLTTNARSLEREGGTILLRYRALMLALAITALGAGLRLVHIGANGLSNDESWSVWIAGQGVIGVARTILFRSVDATPPTYYALLHLFLLAGQQLVVIRALSVIAGTATVWITFQLAAYLFDLRVATLAAFLVAIAPLNITYSQIARAYVLASLWVLLSLYFFAQLLFEKNGKARWLGFMVATVAAIYTFYFTFLVVIFENCVIAFVLLRRHLTRPMFTKWLISQVALAVVLLPTLLSVAFALSYSHGRQGYGLTWIPRPGLAALIKTVILFSTGDPSYGPTGVTVARVLSLLTILGLGALGVRVCIQRGYYRALDAEGHRILFLLSAVFVPWSLTFVISQVRPIYNEKYLVFIMPALLILFAWICIRGSATIAGPLVLVAFVGLTLSALHVYYTEPDGEQWREAVAFVRQAYRSDDQVVISPGYYGRPFSYYFYGDFPENIHALDHTPAITVANRKFDLLKLTQRSRGAPIQEPTPLLADRLWLVSGYAPVDPGVAAWIARNYHVEESRDYVGAHVRLMQRIHNR